MKYNPKKDYSGVFTLQYYMIIFKQPNKVCFFKKIVAENILEIQHS